jgi:UPF0176 protein
MQLYNTLSVEERAIMIDDLKQRLTLSSMLAMQIQDPTHFVTILCGNPLEVLAAFM